MSEHPQRIAVVGGGAVSQLHARAIELVPDAQLAGFVGGDGARTRAMEFDVEHWKDLTSMVARARVGSVVICTPTATHARLGMEAARLGLHVLVEKAMDTSLTAARELIRTARECGVTLGVVSQARFDPAFEELLSAVDNGTLGQLTLASAARKCWRDPHYYHGWHGTKEMDGGGALINQSIHRIDQLCRLMGRARRVTGWARTQAHRIDVEDTALALIEFENGAVGTIEATTAFFSSGSTPAEQTAVDTLEIAGTTGAAILDKGTLTRTWSDDARDRQPAGHDSARIDLFRRQHEDFIQALNTGRPPRVTGEDGYRALELVLAVYESARTGQSIELDVDAASIARD